MVTELERKRAVVEILEEVKKLSIEQQAIVVKKAASFMTQDATLDMTFALRRSIREVRCEEINRR